MVIFKYFLLPWIVFFLYNFLRRTVLKNTILNNSYILGHGIWANLAICLPFFIYGTYNLALLKFQVPYLAAYLLTIFLLALLIIALQFIYFKSFEWSDFFKMWLRLIIIITIMMNLFFTIIFYL